MLCASTVVKVNVPKRAVSQPPSSVLNINSHTVPCTLHQDSHLGRVA
jgi:hypothetical protein